MNTAAEKLQTRRWALAIELSKQYLTNNINYKYGWQNNDDREDTNQEFILLAYNTICKYEQDNNLIIYNFNDIPDIKSKIISKIIGRYRNNVWKNRSDSVFRKSDIYNNVDKGSIDDTNLYSSEYDDLSISLDSTTDDDYYIEINQRRSIICQYLTSILKTDVEKILKAYIYGTDSHGILTHAEIAAEQNKCRSGITRRINRAVSTLHKFLEKNHISYEQIASPSQDDVHIINQITNNYKQQKFFKCKKIVNTNPSVLTIESYFEQYQCSVISNVKYNDLVPANKKRNKIKTTTTLNLNQHTIEEYL